MARPVEQAALWNVTLCACGCRHVQIELADAHGEVFAVGGWSPESAKLVAAALLSAAEGEAPIAARLN